MKVANLLKKAVGLGASDLHLRAGMVPKVRINGKLHDLEHEDIETDNDCKFIYDILSEDKRKAFDERFEVDFAYDMPDLCRVRVNFLKFKDGLGAVFRIIPSEIKPFADLRLSKNILEFAKIEQGLVLVTGPTGSGKSTTLAAIIDYINNTRNCHILAIEDPLEFVHKNNKGMVTHREIGTHTHSFASALRAGLREDPDIILVGELRDMETIQMAITAAETGHLVFSTLHTSCASSTVDRLVNVFPVGQQNQTRVMLSQLLRGVISQQLLLLQNGKGRVCASEIMFCNSAISNLIREGKTHQIFSAIQTGRREGMQTMDQSIIGLVKNESISFDEGVKHAFDKELFNRFQRE